MGRCASGGASSPLIGEERAAQVKIAPVGPRASRAALARGPVPTVARRSRHLERAVPCRSASIRSDRCHRLPTDVTASSSWIGLRNFSTAHRGIFTTTYRATARSRRVLLRDVVRISSACSRGEERPRFRDRTPSPWTRGRRPRDPGSSDHDAAPSGLHRELNVRPAGSRRPPAYGFASCASPGTAGRERTLRATVIESPCGRPWRQVLISRRHHLSA